MEGEEDDEDMDVVQRTSDTRWHSRSRRGSSGDSAVAAVWGSWVH